MTFELIDTNWGRADFSSASGANWTSNYNDDRVYSVSGVSGNVTIVNGMGREDLWTFVGTADYVAPAGVYETLHRNADNTWVRRNDSGIRFDYDANGRLTAITDRGLTDPLIF